MQHFKARLVALLLLSVVVMLAAWPTAAEEAISQSEAQQWFREGYLADTGEGGKKDDARAAEFYLKAAQAGHVEAMRNLAGLYGSGRGVPRDDAESERWFRAAAEAGDAQAQFALGWYILTDRQEKLLWLRRAAAQNHKEAIRSLKGMGEPLVAEAAPAGEAQVAAPLAEAEAAPDAAAGTLLPTPPMPEVVAAKCVQRQLISRGKEIGEIDGKLGPRTRSAAADLAATIGLGDLPELGPQTAEQWCQSLAASDKTLRPFLNYALEEAAIMRKDYGPVGEMRYEIADNVPLDEIDVIKTGMSLADSFLNREIGGGIPADRLARITVKIVATGKGNQDRGGGGASATAYDGPKPRPFFDVRHPQWNQDSSRRGWTTAADSTKTAAHEYVHIWQGHLGGISGVFQPLDGWMNEGIAEYLAYRVMLDAGEMPWDRVRPFILQGAMNDQLTEPLDTLQKRPVWPGHAGFLAIEWLVEDTPNGLMSLRTVAEEIKKGRSAKKAFRTAFGLELADFYEQFEVWRQDLVADRSALYRRPALRLATADTATAAPADAYRVEVEAEPGLLLYILVKDSRNRMLYQNDGTRETAPGLYSLSVPADADLSKPRQVCAIRLEPKELFETGECFEFDADALKAGTLRLILPPPPGR